MTAKSKPNPQETIMEFLQKFPGSPAEAIISATGIFKLNVYKILKSLTAEGKILMDTTDEPAIYTVAKHESKSTTEKEPAREEDDDDDEKKYKNSPKGRDTSKLKFQGQEYGKGQLVLAVVRHHIEGNKRVTFSKLKELFPDELQPRYGTIQEVSKARKLSEGRDRFFLKQEQILKVGDKRIAVCNQWGAHNIKPFLKIAKGLGYSIK